MRVTPSYYAQAWFSALLESPRAEWSEVSGRVLQHVYRHGHVKWLPEIVRRVAELEHQQNGTTPVTIRVAHQLDSEFIQTLLQRFLPDVKPVVEQILEEQLIGGIQIETDTLRYNASVKSQLNQLAHYASH